MTSFLLLQPLNPLMNIYFIDLHACLITHTYSIPTNANGSSVTVLLISILIQIEFVNTPMNILTLMLVFCDDDTSKTKFQMMPNKLRTCRQDRHCFIKVIISNFIIVVLILLSNIFRK